MKTALYKLELGNSFIPVRFVRARNARRYILRMLPGNIARVTIPRGGSLTYAWEFARRNIPWVRKQLKDSFTDWIDGTLVYLRGEPTPLRLLGEPGRPAALLGPHSILLQPGHPVRPQVERCLATLAGAELIPLAWRKAAEQGLEIRKVRVANQRTRWGSCSSAKTISLNWRLIQTPEIVQDYIIIHELMHLREMNHSPRFWAHVAEAFPRYQEAEAWLRKHSQLLR